MTDECYRDRQADRDELEHRIAELCRRILAGKVRERDVRHTLRDLERQLEVARRAERKARRQLERRPEQLGFELRGRCERHIGRE